MRVFVTGGAGYIGSHTLLQLLRDRHDVLVFDNFSNSVPEALARVGQLANAEVQSVTGDIQDQGALDAAMARFRPDAVVHFAGLKAVGDSTAEPLNYYAQNVFGTIALLRAMERVGCDRIVFSSSATVYGVPLYLPYDEAHPCQPTSPYGRTKYFIEEIIRDWCAARAGASAVLLRYFNPVGAHISARIGEDPHGIPNNLVPYIARVAVGRLPFLQVFGDDYETRDGTGERDYIHVDDLAAAHLAALDFAGSRTGAEAINIGTGESVTVLEMRAAFAAASGREIPFQIAPRRDGDIARMLAGVEKARGLLGWQARRGLQDMCASTWAWQRDNPQGYGGGAG